VTAPVGLPLPGLVTAIVAMKVTDWPHTEGLADEVRVVVVSALLTVWLTADDVLLLKLLSPPSTAGMLWLPAGSGEVVQLALPPLRLAVASGLPPSLKVTVPDGVPLPGLVTLTVAVKVTDWPQTEGLTDDVTFADVSALLTTWLSTPELLPIKL